MASSRHVDDAIQFIMFWAPILVLLGWVMQRPMSLLFDLFEVAILIGSCFLLNFVTEDSKTNWAEGVMLVALYLMVVVSAWFYPQQPEIGIMLSRTSIAEALKVSGELDDSSSSMTTLVSAIISTVTATTTIGIGAVVATPTPTPNAKVAATPLSGDASNQALSEKLQELMKLVEQSQKEQKTFEKELNSLKASRTTSSIHPENTQQRNMEDLD
jgi:Ca2+:H+ antiporter